METTAETKTETTMETDTVMNTETEIETDTEKLKIRSKSNSKDEISRAAAILGKKGGSSRSERKVTAVRKNIRKALETLAERGLNTPEIRRAEQLAIPLDKRISRAKKAIKARWDKFETGMTNDEFRLLVTGIRSQDIADGIGVSYARIISWRRKKNPIRISEICAEKVRQFVYNLKHPTDEE